MEKRRVQYLVVDAPAAPWSDEAISFRAELASKADLATVVCKQPDVPQQSRLLLRDADSMWVSWENADELPQNGVLCVEVVKPVGHHDETESFWDLWLGPLSTEADKLRRSLMERLSPTKHKRHCVGTETYELMHNDPHEYRPEVSYQPYRTQALHRSALHTSQ